MKRALLVFCLQILTLAAFSQDGFVRGYIIKLKGDTVRGKIKDRKVPNDKIGWQKIHFINEKGEKEKYTAEDIKGYVKLDTLEFRTLVLGVESKSRFVKVVVKGPVMLFAYSLGLSPNATPDYYLQKEKDVNSLMEWREADYKTTSKYFFKSDAELMTEIDSEILKEKDIETIVRKYNWWKSRQP